jgi:hypothetical protein
MSFFNGIIDKIMGKPARGPIVLPRPNRKQRRTQVALARKAAVEPRRRKYEKRGVKRGR